MKKYLVLLLILFSLSVHTQVRKKLQAKRITDVPKIDGVLNDDIYQSITPADNFSLIWPATRSGKKIPHGYETEVYIGYDHNAMYVAASLRHPNPELIPNEFSQRDNIWDVNAETFFVSINTYNDDLNYFSFQVTSAGTIGDSYSSGPITNVDFAYDTLYDAKVSHDESGWNLEMIIPFSAIRFPKKDPQLWGINFGRKIEEFDETYVWSPVNVNILRFHEYKGLLYGVKNVKPPIRFFLFPYIQSDVNIQKSASPNSSYSAGVDLKYGISSSFTLDTSLIPDFGQVTFDDKRLNLSPFEQEFSDNRPFFTEGAEMFRVANNSPTDGQFFYSRRIGQEVTFDENKLLDDDEIVKDYDSNPQLINLLKVSGVTNKKLSIGMINAITDVTKASIINLIDDTQRVVTISPKTNYNILSLSQQFMNDFSSVSMINTNVNRFNNGHDANSFAFILDLFDDERDFNLKINTFYSNASKYSSTNGFRGRISVKELKGNFRYSLDWSGVDRFYNQNELGFYNLRDHQVFSASINYLILKEIKFFRSLTGFINLSDTYTYHSFDRKKWSGSLSTNFTLKNLTTFNLKFDYNSEYRNYDEPRQNNFRYLIEPANIEMITVMNSNRNKPFSYSIQMKNSKSFNQFYNENRKLRNFSLKTLYRLSNRFSLKGNTMFNKLKDDIGYLFSKENNIYFGRRNVSSVENSMDMTYFMDSKRWLTFKFRNFWSKANYNPVLFRLLENGQRSIDSYSLLESEPNTNFNIWNLDLKFEWWFAPASNLVLLYRNQIFKRDNASSLDYYESLQNLLEEPLQHQLSIRVNYLIDYNSFKQKRNKIDCDGQC
jgi:hypothetical protein